MSKRAYNFNAGPAALPLEVLQQAQEELVEYKGIGMSIMEISHRSKEYEAVNDETQQLFRELLNLPSNYQIMFLQGGASTQFAMIPMNLLREGQTASYVITGSWGDKALKEAQLIGKTSVPVNTKEIKYRSIPSLEDIPLANDTAYLHITSNETIEGNQYRSFPSLGNVPLIGDMSSDILCRPIDASKFGMIYAGAQKNLGPSGVTVVIAKDELIQTSPDNIPTMLKYSTHSESKSLYNTPPVYSIYMVNLVLKWIKSKGGLAAMEQFNKEKTSLIYNVIDQSEGFYKGTVDLDSRSLMNITWRLQDEELEKQFIKETAEAGFVGLKGHRSVGGLRASTYNAVPYESCKALSDFMIDFMKRNG
jgi:phosphoserine aminotransferase